MHVGKNVVTLHVMARLGDILHVCSVRKNLNQNNMLPAKLKRREPNDPDYGGKGSGRAYKRRKQVDRAHLFGAKQFGSAASLLSSQQRAAHNARMRRVRIDWLLG